MKRIKYIGVIVSLIMMISYSCNKEEIVKEDIITFNKLTEEEKVDGLKKVNEISNKEIYYQFKNNMFTEGAKYFSSPENIIEKFTNSDAIDFNNNINVYLQLRNEQPINTEKFVKESFDLIKNTNEFSVFTKHLVDNKMYSINQVELVNSFFYKADKLNTKIEFDENLKEFEDEIFNSDLPEFEKSSLLLFASFVQYYNPEIFTLNIVASKNMPQCIKCINNNSWFIFGIAAIWAVLASIACLIAFGWIGAIICLVGMFGGSVFGLIWGRCRMCF